MSFKKTGAPQRIKIATGVCEICGNKQACFLKDGKLVCKDCKDINSEEK